MLIKYLSTIQIVADKIPESLTQILLNTILGKYSISNLLTLLLLNTACPVLANSVDPDQLASEEANWSGSALFVIKVCKFLSKTSDQVLEVGVASQFI